MTRCTRICDWTPWTRGRYAPQVEWRQCLRCKAAQTRPVPAEKLRPRGADDEGWRDLTWGPDGYEDGAE